MAGRGRNYIKATAMQWCVDHISCRLLPFLVRALGVALVRSETFGAANALISGDGCVNIII